MSATNRIPQWLAYAGLIPFVGLTLLVLFGPAGQHGEFALAQRAYGAVILSFLGGVIWGRALAPAPGDEDTPTTPLYVYSVAPSLLGWVALLAHPLLGLWLLAAAFLLAFGHDWLASRRGLLPQWYVRMRIVLTAVVVVSLATTAIFV